MGTVARIVADAVVLLHFAFVLFVVLGGLVVFRWRWVVWLHLPAAVWGTLVALFDWTCPLTPLENQLRRRAGQAGYEGDFIEHYLLPILYPVGLARETQYVLGFLVVLINVLIYGWMLIRPQRVEVSMAYSHTQKGKWHYLFYTLSISFVLLAWMLREEPAALFGLLLAAALMLIAALGFGYLTVRDEGLWLAIRYGPLPLFAKRIPYAAMKSVEPDRSSVIDGWGIHWIPGRGWVYNLWGFDCVKVSLSRRVIRIGTDDVKNLVAFLRTKVQEGP